MVKKVTPEEVLLCCQSLREARELEVFCAHFSLESILEYLETCDLSELPKYINSPSHLILAAVQKRLKEG